MPLDWLGFEFDRRLKYDLPSHPALPPRGGLYLLVCHFIPQICAVTEKQNYFSLQQPSKALFRPRSTSRFSLFFVSRACLSLCYTLPTSHIHTIQKLSFSTFFVLCLIICLLLYRWGRLGYCRLLGFLLLLALLLLLILPCLSLRRDGNLCECEPFQSKHNAIAFYFQNITILPRTYLVHRVSQFCRLIVVVVVVVAAAPLAGALVQGRVAPTTTLFLVVLLLLVVPVKSICLDNMLLVNLTNTPGS